MYVLRCTLSGEFKASRGTYGLRTTPDLEKAVVYKRKCDASNSNPTSRRSTRNFVPVKVVIALAEDESSGT